MINARWYELDNNWGDKLNPYLIEKISGEKVQFTKHQSASKFLCVGSTLQYADDNTTVWGSGFISSSHHTIGTPKILAVRGPKTRQKLLQDNIECPDVYGDPALLMSRYYMPSIEKKYPIGIIPHYIDKGNQWLKQFFGSRYVKLIDIQGPIEGVVNDILSCNIILSSSLHGVIAADAYDIKGYWIKLSDRVVGGSFKFEDYFLSVGRPTAPIIISDITELKSIKDQFYNYKIDIDLHKLMDVCPFNRNLNHI